MDKRIQRSTFETLLITHGMDFGSAYADLAEQVDENLLVSESMAMGWAKRFEEEERKAQSREILTMAMAGESLPVRAANYAKLDRDKKVDVLTDEFLTFSHVLIGDHSHEVFEPRDRVNGIPRIAELLGIPQRLQQKRSAPQEAHRAVPKAAFTFGTIPDRMVFATYVREGENVESLRNWLITADPSLSYLSGETVAEKLRLWRKDGVVMDDEGTVLEWDEATSFVRAGLKLAISAP